MIDREYVELRRAVFERVEMIRTGNTITYSLANGLEFRTVTTQYPSVDEAVTAMAVAIILCLTKGFMKHAQA